MKVWATAGSPRKVVIELGSPATRTPLNFMRHAARALRRGLAEPDLDAGASVAIMLVTLAVETARALGGWGHPVVDIRAALLDVKDSALRCVTVAQGQTAELTSDIAKTAEECIRLLDEDHAH